MELNELEQLILLLRKHGVLEYSAAGVALKLGEIPASVPATDLNKDGFVPSTGRDPALQSVLDRLPTNYSDPALFDIR